MSKPGPEQRVRKPDLWMIALPSWADTPVLSQLKSEASFRAQWALQSSIFQNSSFNGKASSWVSEVQVTHLGPPMAYVNARHKLRSQLKVEWIREWMNEWHFWPQGPQESEKLEFGVCNDRNPLPLILNPFIHLTLNMLSFWGPNKKELNFLLSFKIVWPLPLENSQADQTLSIIRTISFW